MASDVPTDLPQNVPLACSLTAAELGVRGEENASLFARAHDVEELPDGYRFAFPAEADGIPDLLRFILAERACCPFFTFELTFASPHQTVWLAERRGEGDGEVGGIDLAGGHDGGAVGPSWQASLAKITTLVPGLYRSTIFLPSPASRRLNQRLPSRLRADAWYAKARPTFADALALVRRHLGTQTIFQTSPSPPDTITIPPDLFGRLCEQLCYAA
jgi:hypothetical protein